MIKVNVPNTDHELNDDGKVVNLAENTVVTVDRQWLEEARRDPKSAVDQIYKTLEDEPEGGSEA